jgi:AcrR family transcriptional regulator
MQTPGSVSVIDSAVQNAYSPVMARPKAFDRDEALQAGVEAFWRQGYAATTTDDLARAMGIGRQSFYDTFGDKRRCYLEALRSYARAEIGRQIAAMRGLAPLDAMRALLRGPANAAKARRGLGCLAVNAFTEPGGQDLRLADPAGAAEPRRSRRPARDRLLIAAAALGGRSRNGASAAGPVDRPHRPFRIARRRLADRRRRPTAIGSRSRGSG